jgi:hypothetical protein
VKDIGSSYSGKLGRLRILTATKDKSELTDIGVHFQAVRASAEVSFESFDVKNTDG